MKEATENINVQVPCSLKWKFEVECKHVRRFQKVIINQLVSEWTNKMRKKRGLKEII